MLVLKETEDTNIIKEVLSTCYTDITSDISPAFEDLTPKLEDRTYYAGFVEDVAVGIVVYCKRPDKTMVHIVVKPEYRGRYAWVLANMALMKRKGTIFTEIPDLYQNVIKFAERLGFENIGKSKKSTIDGVEYAVHEMRLD